MNCPATQGILVFQDTATIPCVLLPVRAQVASLTRVLLFVSIPVALVFFWLKMRGGERVFGDLLRVLVVFITLAGYDGWFEDGVTMVGAVAQSLYPSALVLAFYERIWQSSLIPGSVGSFVGFLSDPMGILYLVLLDGLKVIVLAFSLVRYALLAFLYIVGPLLLAVAVVPGLFFLVGQWARNALEISLWLLFHNLLIGIFSSINLYQALSAVPVSQTLVNRVLEIGILLVLVLMILFVPILTHLLLDRSYEGIGSFMGPQAESLGRNLWHNMVSKPLLKGELPFGMGEFKAGTTTKDLGQGRRVYRKRQLRLGPLDFTSMVWQRAAKAKKTKEEGESRGKDSESKENAKDGGEEGKATKKTRATRTRKTPAKKTARAAKTTRATMTRVSRKKTPPTDGSPEISTTEKPIRTRRKKSVAPPEEQNAEEKES
ncbi:MAG: hypothetical protein ACP5OS_05005 [Leptospirillia bacterium]